MDVALVDWLTPFYICLNICLNGWRLRANQLLCLRCDWSISKLILIELLVEEITTMVSSVFGSFLNLNKTTSTTNLQNLTEENCGAEAGDARSATMTGGLDVPSQNI